MCSSDLEQVREVLRKSGIDPKSAELGFYSLQPVYDYKTAKRKVIGYRVTASVSTKLKDFSKIGGLVQQFADIDATENQSVSYTLENLDTAKQKAVEDAFQRAHASAETIARVGHRALGELLYSSVDTFEQVRVIAQAGRGPMRTMAAEVAPPTEEFSPQKIVVTAHVNALFALK